MCVCVCLCVLLASSNHISYPPQAVAARDSLAKALYGSLFDWIVDQVNISLASSSTRGHIHKVWNYSSMGVWNVGDVIPNIHVHVYSVHLHCL